MPMPVSMPSTTAEETARNQRPRRSSASSTCTRPAVSTSRPSAGSPKVVTAEWTSTVRPAAGPLTCRLLPGSAPATRPPTMPVTRPSSAGAPEATETPTQSGTATRKTVIEAGRSVRSTARTRVAFQGMAGPRT